MTGRSQLPLSTAILLLAVITPAFAVEDARARLNYELGCALIQQLGGPVERIASQRFSERWPRIGTYQGHPVYRFSPEPALSVIMVLGEHERKLLSEASLHKAYLHSHRITAASVRLALQLGKDQALPDNVGCDLHQIALKGKDQLESIIYSQMID